MLRRAEAWASGEELAAPAPQIQAPGVFIGTDLGPDMAPDMGPDMGPDLSPDLGSDMGADIGADIDVTDPRQISATCSTSGELASSRNANEQYGRVNNRRILTDADARSGQSVVHCDFLLQADRQ